MYQNTRIFDILLKLVIPTEDIMETRQDGSGLITSTITLIRSIQLNKTKIVPLR